MTFPTVGIIASHQVRGIYEFEALKLGIKVNFISEKCSVEELIDFSQGCDLICVDPKIISPASIKTVEKAGIKIYPSTNTLEQFQKISTSKNNGERLSILVARSATSSLRTSRSTPSQAKAPAAVCTPPTPWPAPSRPWA